MNFKNLTNKLLNKQEEERVALANKQESAKDSLANKIMDCMKEGEESLAALGYQYKNNEPIIKTVEVEKIVKVEVPVEVPTKELENLKISNSELEAIIKTLNKQNEMLKEQNKTLASKLDDAEKQLASKDAMYNGLLKDLNNRVFNVDNVISDNEVNNSKAKKHVELELPKINNKDIRVIKNYDKFILGEYKQVIFEASKNMDCITIYNPKKHYLKEEINKALIEQNVLNPNRETKDKARIECESGVCHEISPNKYMGYFMDNNKPVCYIFDTAYNNGSGTPTTQKLDVRMKNPKKGYSKCKDAVKIKKINELIDLHIAKEEELSNNIDRTKAYEFLGINNVDDNKVENNTEKKHTPLSNTTGAIKKEEKKEVVTKKETMGDMFSFDTSFESVEL